MDLRERLRMLKAAGAQRVPMNRPAALPVGANEVSPSGAIGRPAIDDLALPQATTPNRPVTLAGGIDGYEVQTPFGPAFYVETRYPMAYYRGPLPLQHVHQVPARAWSLLGRLPAGHSLKQAVFFDTETTGLAGGSGTYAFLVGLGFFQGADFVVRQYFLRDYPEEEAVLEAVAADLAPFDLLVSFNGKSFDWPLMETRYRMARRKPPLGGRPHLDLLHPARRIWKDRLVHCNLTNLEAQILGVQRTGDVAGHLIPPLYFDYLRTGDATPLANVVLHNRLDILSLVSLAGWLGQVVDDPLGCTPDGELVCGDDLFTVGCLLEHRGEFAEAIACFEVALDRGLSAIGEARVQRQLSRAYKRVKEHDRAVAIWEAMTQGSGRLILYPYVELAKYYEHVVKDLSAAKAMVHRALAIAEHRRSLGGVTGPTTLRDLAEVQHRMQRLDRKLTSQGKGQ